MALIIEDGTGKADAESFATAAELVAYAAKFGLATPATEAEQEALLRNSALQMQTMPWKGYRTFVVQALSWPRENVDYECEILPNNIIPARIQYGQMALALEIYQDQLSPPQTRKGPRTKERVEGAVDVQYAAISSANWRYSTPAAAERPSYAQFSDYLTNRGLFAVRA